MYNLDEDKNKSKETDVTLGHKDFRGGSIKYKYGKRLKSLVWWPVVVWIGLAVLTAIAFLSETEFAYPMLISLIIYSVFASILIAATRKGIRRDLLEFGMLYSIAQHKMLFDLEIPFAILEENGQILWMNEKMMEVTRRTNDYKQNIATIFKEITPNLFPEAGSVKKIEFDYGSRNYLAKVENIVIGGDRKDSGVENSLKFAGICSCSFITVVLFDKTNELRYKKKLVDSRLAMAIIDIDNYEDSIDNISEVRQNFVIGTVDKIVYEYFEKADAFVKKLDKERYMAVFTRKDLGSFKSDGFEGVIDEVKKIDAGEGSIPITLSIGVGVGQKKFSDTYELAKTALFLALGRGGDQAVVKDGEGIEYFGGKTQQVEKNTRVKVRVKAGALKTILLAHEKVIVMGHKNIDIDAFGGCVGIYEVARKLGKEAHIVLGNVTSGIRPFYERFLDREEYAGNAFVDAEEALEIVDDQTVVVVVDVNRPSLTECPDLVEAKKGALVVFDHHRKCTDDIKGADLSYVDTSASSTCEMVTEIIQYIDTDIELMGFESDALLGGIIIDTDGFKSKAGPRTFEAAAFLRRHGADVVRIRKLLRGSMEEYKAITEAAASAHLYDNGFAIGVLDGDMVENSPIAAAKAANQLMNIKGVRAAFVLTETGSDVAVSARSLEDVNVQRIMEKLGGGGHLSIAGAQLKDVTIDEAEKMLVATIREMIKNGEI